MDNDPERVKIETVAVAATKMIAPQSLAPVLLTPKQQWQQKLEVIRTRNAKKADLSTGANSLN